MGIETDKPIFIYYATCVHGSWSSEERFLVGDTIIASTEDDGGGDYEMPEKECMRAVAQAAGCPFVELGAEDIVCPPGARFLEAAQKKLLEDAAAKSATTSAKNKRK